MPDKAIDALDESGSRVHISNIQVPENVIKLEDQIEEIKAKKISAVKAQNFEIAARHRDKEKEFIQQLEIQKKKWEEQLNQNREIVDAGNVEEVVAMIIKGLVRSNKIWIKPEISSIQDIYSIFYKLIFLKNILKLKKQVRQLKI